jgi:hypothetical protein
MTAVGKLFLQPYHPSQVSVRDAREIDELVALDRAGSFLFMARERSRSGRPPGLQPRLTLKLKATCLGAMEPANPSYQRFTAFTGIRVHNGLVSPPLWNL